MDKTPWQIWVVIVLLALEGLSNLFMIDRVPMAVFWLAAKCLFITGLLKQWKWVYILFLTVAGMHVIGFMGLNFIAALINLAMIVLAVSAMGHYFPNRRDRLTYE